MVQHQEIEPIVQVTVDYESCERCRYSIPPTISNLGSGKHDTKRNKTRLQFQSMSYRNSCTLVSDLRLLRCHTIGHLPVQSIELSEEPLDSGLRTMNDERPSQCKLRNPLVRSKGSRDYENIFKFQKEN